MKRAKSEIGLIVERLSEQLNPSRWADIDTLRELARISRIIDRDDPKVVEAVLAFAEGELIRKAMQRKDPEGFPLFPSILLPQKEGEKRKRLYMSERRMKVIHYQEFAGECDNKVFYWQRLSNAARKRANYRYHVQLELRWPEVEDGDRKAG